MFKQGVFLKEDALLHRAFIFSILALIILGLALTACTASPRDPTNSILMIIAPQNFREDTTLGPKGIFEGKGLKVVLASTTTDVATGVNGTKLTPQLKFTQVSLNDYDAVVVAGGRGVKEKLWGNGDAAVLLNKAYSSGKVVAGICYSPVLIGQAGLLNGKQATVLSDEEAIVALKDTGAVYTNQDVVVSGRIVTGRDPDAATKFALTVYDLLQAKR